MRLGTLVKEWANVSTGTKHMEGQEVLPDRLICIHWSLATSCLPFACLQPSAPEGKVHDIFAPLPDFVMLAGRKNRLSCNWPYLSMVSAITPRLGVQIARFVFPFYFHIKSTLNAPYKSALDAFPWVVK